MKYKTSDDKSVDGSSSDDTADKNDLVYEDIYQTPDRFDDMPGHLLNENLPTVPTTASGETGAITVAQIQPIGRQRSGGLLWTGRPLGHGPAWL